MSAEELGQHRNDRKREYEAERDLTTQLYREKVTAENLAALEVASHLPPGSINVVTPLPARLAAEGQAPS